MFQLCNLDKLSVPTYLYVYWCCLQ